MNTAIKSKYGKLQLRLREKNFITFLILYSSATVRDETLRFHIIYLNWLLLQLCDTKSLRRDFNTNLIEILPHIMRIDIDILTLISTHSKVVAIALI